MKAKAGARRVASRLTEQIEKQAERIKELEAENKALRRPLEVANFKVDGMLAVGNELINRAKRIKDLEALLNRCSDMDNGHYSKLFEDIEQALKGEK